MKRINLYTIAIFFFYCVVVVHGNHKNMMRDEVHNIFRDNFNIDDFMQKKVINSDNITMNIHSIANEITDLFISHHVKYHLQNKTKYRRKLLTHITPDEIANGELRGGEMSEPTPSCRRSVGRWLKDCVYSFDAL